MLAVEALVLALEVAVDDTLADAPPVGDGAHRRAVHGAGLAEGPPRRLEDRAAARRGAVGPRCQPSAIARRCPDATMTRPVTARDAGEASQTRAGDTHFGSYRPARASSVSARKVDAVMSVSAVGQTALTVTPYRASSMAAISVNDAIPPLAAP